MRMRVRTLMIVVAVCALLLAAVGPGRQWYRRWIYHRSQVAFFAKMERRERVNSKTQSNIAASRALIQSQIADSEEFAGANPIRIEDAVDRTIEFHKHLAKQALRAADDWEEKRKLSEQAAFWCWDPFAPDVP